MQNWGINDNGDSWHIAAAWNESCLFNTTKSGEFSDSFPESPVEAAQASSKNNHTTAEELWVS